MSPRRKYEERNPKQADQDSDEEIDMSEVDNDGFPDQRSTDKGGSCNCRCCSKSTILLTILIFICTLCIIGIGIHRIILSPIQLQAENQQLRTENHQLRSLLSSNTILERYCNLTSLVCSRCMPGWIERADRCFRLYQNLRKWQDARRHCVALGGDLAIVMNIEDQKFLTNLSFHFGHLYPDHGIYSTWIGMEDMVKEGIYVWVNGEKLDPELAFWTGNEPNNIVAPWDESRAGQDCVAIVKKESSEPQDWFMSWDDIVCSAERTYICETKTLTVPFHPASNVTLNSTEVAVD